MIRSTKYSLKYLTKEKEALLKEFFSLYKKYLTLTIDLLWRNQVPRDTYLSSKDIYWMDNLGGQYKQLIYKHASEIVKSAVLKQNKDFRKRKNKSKSWNKKHLRQNYKPKIKNVSINFDQRFVTIEKAKTSKMFDSWVILKLPFILENTKNKRMETSIPIKEHKHSLKYSDWRKANTVKISENGYASFSFSKEQELLKQDGEVLGLDSGYVNLLATSDGRIIGKEMEEVYTKITKKKRGSKAFSKSVIMKNNKINEIINKEVLPLLSTTKEVVMEDLKNLKFRIKGKRKKEFNNKYQYWTYSQMLQKIERLCEENRVLFTKVDPSYTSQECPNCHSVQSKNRKRRVLFMH